MILKSRVTILVKAYPQPSSRYAETVCCAGLDDGRKWRRLYPIRFRQLQDEQAFRRWDIVEYDYSPPRQDTRSESCHVHEESIKLVGSVKREQERSTIVESAIVQSEKHAMSLGQSLALVRPKNVKLRERRRSQDEILQIQSRYRSNAKQGGFFDKELAELNPCRFEFFMSFTDGAGRHTKRCADWETEAAFNKFSRTYGDARAIEILKQKYCEEYVETGLVLALGNIAARPKTWQLLGILPVRQSAQAELF